MIHTDLDKAPRTEAGFSLIETLVALVIMSIAMSAFYTTMSTSYRAAAQVKAHQVALQLARSHLDSLGRDAPIEPGESSGTYESGLQWRLTIEALLPDASRSASAAQPFWVSLETFDRHGAYLLKLETIKLGVGPSS